MEVCIAGRHADRLQSVVVCAKRCGGWEAGSDGATCAVFGAFFGSCVVSLLGVLRR